MNNPWGQTVLHTGEGSVPIPPALPPGIDTDRNFTCALCGGEFTGTRTHEECMEEHRLHFTPVPVEEMAVVCDACWNKIHPQRN